jgi:CelD/BcsL family acetyltransferase involved in cellulose biosynthesis
LADQNNPIQIEKLHLPGDALDAELRRAFTTYEAKNPQYGADWLANLASHALDDHDAAVIYIARLGPENFVACPLRIDSRDKRAYSLSTFYTSAYSPLVCSDTPETLFLALFQHLAKTEKLAMLTLSPMDPDAPEFGHMQRALSRAGWTGTHAFFCFGNWIHDVQGHSYQTYLGSRPSSLRNTIARKTRKFFDADRGQIEIVEGGDALEAAITRYVTVYNNSWKNEEPYQDFTPALLRLAANRTWLRLGIASYDNVPVASQIWLVCGGTAYIFKLAYDENYKHLSAGTVLTAHMMQRAIDSDHIARIDYLSGDDAYKADWMSERRQQYGIAAYNPYSLRGMAMLMEYKLRKLAKTLWKRER